MAAEESTIRKVMEEAYKRLIPAAAYLVSSKAGFLASVVVFTTWLIKHGRSRYGGFSIEEDDKVVARLLEDIRAQEARVRLLEKARERSAGSPGSRVIDDVLEAEKAVLDNLVTELELRQLRLEALRRLKSIGDPRVTKAVKDLVRRIEEGKGFEEEQLRVMKELEERWRRKEIEVAALKEVLRYAI